MSKFLLILIIDESYMSLHLCYCIYQEIPQRLPVCVFPLIGSYQMQMIVFVSLSYWLFTLSILFGSSPYTTPKSLKILWFFATSSHTHAECCQWCRRQFLAVFDIFRLYIQMGLQLWGGSRGPLGAGGRWSYYHYLSTPSVGLSSYVSRCSPVILYGS